MIEPGQRVLEIGTGSGLIAVAIAKSHPDAWITATDVNVQSLNVAKLSARKNGVRIDFQLRDLFNECESDEFDVIVSHPPAIPYAEGTWGMSSGMTIATNGGKDGALLFSRLITEAPRYLRNAGLLILGVPHWTNFRRVLDILNAHFTEVHCEMETDAKFIPFLRGDPSAGQVAHIRSLVDRGLVSIDFDRVPPTSSVSIMSARNSLLRAA